MNFQNQITYLRSIGEDMLAGVEVPTPLQAETLKSQIVLRCGLLEPVYSEPDIMQYAIGHFFRREQWNITHLINIILAEYSPIENTDRYSEHTTSSDSSRTVTSKGSGSEAHSGTDRHDTQHSGKDQRDEAHSGTDERDEQHGGTDTTTNTVSAYNSSTYQPDSQQEMVNGHKIDDDLTYGHKIDDDLTYGHKIEDDLTYGHKIDRTTDNVTSDSGSGTDTYTEHTHGNIGVTTNQEMIQQELQLLRSFDVYDWIAAKLENELFIQVY